MTIASHCLDLLRAHGPLSAEELGAMCRRDGVSAAQKPESSVTGALSWHTDGRAVAADGRWHRVIDLLDGRWLTFARPPDPRSFDGTADLECLRGAADSEGIPLEGGGFLRRRPYRQWTAPPGWLPDGELIGLRLVDGLAEVSAVELDDEADARGSVLAELVLAEPGLGRGWGRNTTACFTQALLRCVAAAPDLLRRPVAPLSALLPVDPPAPAHPALPYGDSLTLRLSPDLMSCLRSAAERSGRPVAEWLADELERWSAWPHPPEDLTEHGGYDQFGRYDGRSGSDAVDYLDTVDEDGAFGGYGRSAPVVPLDGWRGGTL